MFEFITVEGDSGEIIVNEQHDESVFLRAVEQAGPSAVAAYIEFAESFR